MKLNPKMSFASLSLAVLMLTSHPSAHAQKLNLSRASSFAQDSSSLLPRALSPDPTASHFSADAAFKTARTSSATFQAASGHRFQISIVSEEQAQWLYGLAASDGQIPFQYLGDGCYANAHKITQTFEGLGIIAGKVHAEGSLKYQTAKKEIRTWEFHVATLIAVQTAEGPVPYVIDPAFASSALPHTEWLAKLQSLPGGKVTKTFFTKRFNYLPPDATADMNQYDEFDTENMNRTLDAYRAEVKAGRFHR